MPDMPLLDYAAAQIDKQVALEQVMQHATPWPDLAMMELRRLPLGMIGTAEYFRFALLERGVASPHHHNAWGGLIAHAVRAGVLVPTGEWRAMGGPKSHARKSPVYRRV